MNTPQIRPIVCFYQRPTRLARWSCWLLLPLLLLVLSGCISITAEEATPVPTPSPQAGPVVALAPASARPGTTIFLSSAGWQADDVVTIRLVSIQAGVPVTTTIFTDAATEEGRLNASFRLPLDLDKNDEPVVTVVLTSNTTGAQATSPFVVAVATAMPTPLTTITATPSATSTSTAAATSVATATPLPTLTAIHTPVATRTVAPSFTATPRPVDFALVTSAGLNLRAGPATSFPVIRALPARTGLTVLGRNAGGDWLAVRLADGVQGWLAARFTDYTGNAPVITTPPPPTTPTPTPLSTPVPGITEWRGEYYNNVSLLYPPVFVRNDSAIDFDWGRGSPGAGIPNDSFSVRWTRSVYFSEGTYRFSAASDDGVRVWIDGDLVIDEWRDSSSVTHTVDRRLSTGNHSLRVEYYDNTGSASIRFRWERSGSSGNYPDWRGEYWSNRRLDGNSAFVRNDEEIDFNWGSGSPDGRLPSDNFSVRWTRTVDFDAGLYRFSARADDGIRVYLDDELILDEWHDGLSNVEYTVDQRLDNDDYRIRVEYYERTGGARAEFSWRRISATATPIATPTWTPVPSVTVPATATAVPTVPPTATALPTVPPTATAVPTVPPTPTVTATATSVPFATVSPATGRAGTVIALNGGGFPANTTINVHLGALVNAAAVDTPHVYATTTTDSDGDYGVTFPMPANWPDGSPVTAGQLVVLVVTEDFTAQASALFTYSTTPPTVTPTATATATTVATSTATVTPTAAATATATVTPVAIATATVTPLPASPTATPTPLPHVELTPGTGSANMPVMLSGGGFPANASLYVYLGAFDGAIDPGANPEHYVILTTDAAGDYTGVLTMPRTWPNGDPIPAGPVIVLIATNDFGVQASAVFTYTEAVVAP